MAINARSALESLTMFGMVNGHEKPNTGGIGASIKGVTTADKYERTPKPTKKAKKPFGARQDSVAIEQDEVTPDSPMVSKVLGLVRLLDNAGLEAVLFLIAERLKIQADSVNKHGANKVPVNNVELTNAPVNTVNAKDIVNAVANADVNKDRKEYMRQYMKEQRAKKKASNGQV